MYIQNPTADKESLTASFTLCGFKANDVSKLTAYVAEYDDGVLVKLTPKTFTESDFADADSDTKNISIPFTMKDNGNSVRLFVWNDMQPLPEQDSTVTVTTNVQNYTADSASLTPTLYAVSESGEETEIDIDADPTVFASLDEKPISFDVAASTIPSDCKKLILKLTNSADNNSTDTVATLYNDITAPVAAPADSDSTTNGAHDPSIVQFPNDDNFYVYSSHHLIFKSPDLINWTKYDFTSTYRTSLVEKNSDGTLTYPNAKMISQKTYDFIANNYSNTTVNGTYWAPDVIYKEGDEHPYWMYISVSCGLGGRNSAISLMKSDSPLFWADENADIVDAGVVFATKESSDYITNAIDANIYTDTDGTQYFIYGSFWGGIQALKLKDDGFIDGVDYTSDSTILSSCKSIASASATTVYSQKNGVAGPEGAWMLNHGGYRYMFTSYGWLGSNYNTRIARSSTGTSFGTNTTTQLTDANNTIMGTQYSKGSTASPSGYKLIGSYRLGDGLYTLSGNDSDGYSVDRTSGDAHVYYGPGHNSAINVGDESFYCSHTRKDAIEISATLQIRKMLYTKDGWPVVSPVTYSGEVEQALPKEMLVGTYDLASVGHTKMSTSTIAARNFDLPVLSSKVTLNADGTLADSLGTWTFDGDHTVTLKFTKDGDTTKDEFYKSGDTMTLYALYSYDKDEAEPVIALTGTDQNHITQFAKKGSLNVYKTTPKTVENVTLTSIAKSTGGNPELGFDASGNTLYGGDPAATVIDTDGDGTGDTVYMIVGHDTATGDGYVMPNWVVYTSKDMVNWEYKSIAMEESSISWTADKTTAWASQMIEHNGKYYLYYCAETKSTLYSGKSIGVAVADKPEGPYKDIGQPLVLGSFTTPETSNYNDIDPTVWVETVDGVEHRYLAWGNGKYYVCELNDDMTSIKDLDGDGEIVMHKDVKQKTIKSMGSGVYTEAPWIYRRQDENGNYYGQYYLFYAMNWREEMAYAMTDDLITGRYDYIQTIMPPTATSNTNHPAVIDFNGKTYFIYHNGSLPWGSGYRRSVCIQELKFDENGYVYPLTETSIGLDGTASTIVTSDSKYVGHDAFTNSSLDGDYPISKAVTVSNSEREYNTAWEIKPAKSVPSGENAENYVSIQSVDKPGLYITADGSSVKLTQDSDGNQGSKMTFKTVKGIDGKENTVSFESVSEPGKFLTVLNKEVTLSYGSVPADASFTIGEVTTSPQSVINVAQKEADPTPDADITQDFNSLSTGTLISIATTDTPAYTEVKGVTLYIGTRDKGADTTSYFSIASGGESGNALLMSSGKFVSSSRGPRMQINTPSIPDGYTVTASIRVKQGKDGSILRYNDSTSSETGTQINGLSTSWQTLTITISNKEELYTRTIKLGDTVIATDYVDAFPVFWGTTTDSTYTSIYFDNLSITTALTSTEEATNETTDETTDEATNESTENSSEGSAGE